ncbi:hypothetical protein FFLO_06945 [Filobasidium floriforme]|uniref:Uncharacterized protein n=1 Tax=Filobasidium floriforme TaxID=5210 RepID=A0A8K0NMC9_9TREE|nr:hypothetical protein FFLO_06945 [Filobasidium floriforme]
MGPETQPTDKEVIKISGKEFTRKGVEAFVFIHLDGWEVCYTDNDTRHSLFRNIVRNVWKSLAAGAQPISEITVCMKYSGWASDRSGGWEPPVDYVLDSFGGDQFKTWSRSCLPLKQPIVVVSVTDHQTYWPRIFDKIQPCNLLALHKLEYLHYVEPDTVCQEIYKRDPEGTIEIRKVIGRESTTAILGQDV